MRQKLQHRIRARRHRERITTKRTFGTMAAAGTAAYLRSRDLPKLIALWPHELDDESQEGMFRVLAKLRRALRAERSRGLAGHWSYDLNRHLGLLSAYKGRAGGLAREPAEGLEVEGRTQEIRHRADTSPRSPG